MSASKIQSTTNYSRFKFMDGNRPVNNARVRKLIRSIKRKNMLQQFPIVCQKNSSGLYIMDGQHRFTAAEQLKLPVFFIEGKNIEISDIAATNSAQKGWTPRDFVESFAAQGNAEYVKLRDFINEHGLPVTTSANILAGNFNDTGCIQHAISVGTFKVTSFEFANRVAGGVRACQPFFAPYKDRGFVIAVAHLLRVKGFSITRFVQKLEHQSAKMIKCSAWVQYVDVIEEIYNWKCRADDIVALAIEVKRALAK